MLRYTTLPVFLSILFLYQNRRPITVAHTRWPPLSLLSILLPYYSQSFLAPLFLQFLYVRLSKPGAAVQNNIRSYFRAFSYLVTSKQKQTLKSLNTSQTWLVFTRKILYFTSVAVSDRISHLECGVVFGELINDRCILLLLRYAAFLMFIPFPSVTKPFLLGAFWFKGRQSYCVA